MSGDELRERISDRDNRLSEIIVRHTRRAPKGAGAGHVSSIRRSAAAISLHEYEDRGEGVNSHEVALRGGKSLLWNPAQAWQA